MCRECLYELNERKRRFQGIDSGILLIWMRFLGKQWKTGNGNHTWWISYWWCHIAEMGCFFLRFFTENEGSFLVRLCLGTYQWMDRPYFWLQAEWNFSSNLRQYLLLFNLPGKCQFWSTYVSSLKSITGSTNCGIWANATSAIWGSASTEKGSPHQPGTQQRYRR